MLESGSWGHSVLQIPALVFIYLRLSISKLFAQSPVINLIYVMFCSSCFLDTVSEPLFKPKIIFEPMVKIWYKTFNLNPR